MTKANKSEKQVIQQGALGDQGNSDFLGFSTGRGDPLWKVDMSGACLPPWPLKMFEQG